MRPDQAKIDADYGKPERGPNGPSGPIPPEPTLPDVKYIRKPYALAFFASSCALRLNVCKRG